MVEHTIYSVVNVLRPTVWTNQNNFAQLLYNQFSCCVCCNLPMPVPNHSITTVTCTNHTRTNSMACTTVVFTFNYFLCDNTLCASYAHIATHQFFDPALPGTSAASAASLAIISILLQHFGQSLFICPNSLHAKHLILLASHCYNCPLQLQKSLHTGIPERSKHNISQVHWRIARATCTTCSACTTNKFFLELMGQFGSLHSRCKAMGGVQAISFGHCFINGLWTCHH